MSDRRDRAVLVALAVVVVAALVPAFAAGRPANQIPVHESTAGDSLANPDGEAWSNAEPVTIRLASAPSSVPDAADTSVRELTVRMAHTDDRLYVRLSWADATRDAEIEGPRDFADAVAVQWPANASTHPGIAMGSTRNPVNVWYWTPPTGTEELLAGGPGSTTRVDPAVETAVSYSGDGWTVVFHRALTAGEDRTAFRMDRDVDVAFAVWNGSNMERSGRKAVTDWYHLPLGPAPQGPPYETILWAIAGVAIVVVIVVTAVAVRRGDSGGNGGSDGG